MRRRLPSGVRDAVNGFACALVVCTVLAGAFAALLGLCWLDMWLVAQIGAILA